MEDFGDFPKSVIAGILEHLKPRYRAIQLLKIFAFL